MVAASSTVVPLIPTIIPIGLVYLTNQGSVICTFAHASGLPQNELNIHVRIIYTTINFCMEFLFSMYLEVHTLNSSVAVVCTTDQCGIGTKTIEYEGSLL